DFFAPTQLRLDKCRAVIDAGLLELRKVLDRQLSILSAGSDDHALALDLLSVFHGDRVGLAFAGKTLCAFGDHHLRPEFLRLRIRSRGEVLSRDPGRKSEVVFDLRARGGL